MYVYGHVTYEGGGKVELESSELRLELRGLLLPLPALCCDPAEVGTRRVAPPPSVCSLDGRLAPAVSRDSSSSSVSEPSPATTPGTGLSLEEVR